VIEAGAHTPSSAFGHGYVETLDGVRITFPEQLPQERLPEERLPEEQLPA
jgi:hypothetical protein